ncbi:MAG: hypothetical protein HY550_06740, partial [Elusimicrobia bacterium]|nr:hypothetical protein [Elusimicrobiota bacterium]
MAFPLMLLMEKTPAAFSKKAPGKAPAAFYCRAGLEISGFRVNFKSDSVGIISVLKRRYGLFAAGKAGGYAFSVSAGPGRQEPFKPSIYFDGSRLELKRGDFKAGLDMKSRAGTLEAATNEQCLDAFLRSFISFLLLRSGGFMLHSAGLVKGGKAYLFLGKSGAGKSTLSKLAAAAGAEVISDEINLVRPAPGLYRVHGSPFWGEMRADGRPGSWPLGGIFLLGKARINRVLACSGGEALKLLLRCLVNFDKSPEGAGLVLE